jgi:hypothetical protein
MIYIVVYILPLCDKVCQWLATGRWFSPGTTVSSTNKIDRHDITEILLTVALNTINQPIRYILLSIYCLWLQCNCRRVLIISWKSWNLICVLGLSNFPLLLRHINLTIHVYSCVVEELYYHCATIEMVCYRGDWYFHLYNTIWLKYNITNVYIVIMVFFCSFSIRIMKKN